MRARVLAVILAAGCGGPRHVASDAPEADGSRAVDAAEGTGFRVTVTATGIRDPGTFVLTTAGAPDQRIAITEDGAVQFPLRVADQAQFAVAYAGPQLCTPAVSGTVAGADANVAFTCDGVLEIGSVAFSVHVAMFPQLDPASLAYVGYEPRLLEPGDPVSVTATARDANATATPNPASTVVDTPVTVDISEAGITRAYLFALRRELLQEQKFGASSYVGTPGPGVVNHTLAFSGDTMAIGEPTRNVVFVFVRTGSVWSEQQIIKPATFSGHGFGDALALQGDTLVIGAPTSTLTSSGAAFVYTRSGTTWSATATLDPGVTPGSSYGLAVALSGNYAAVADPWVSSSQGTVYVFKFDGTTWGVDTQLVGPAASSEFGLGVSLDGSNLAIGAPGTSSDSGTVYVYSGPTWSQAFSDTGVSGSRLGESISINGTLLAAGARLETVSGAAGAGTAHLYRFATTWATEATLSAATPAANDHFGASVAVDREHVIVGAPGDSCNGTGVQPTCTGTATNSGATYLFRKPAASWVQDRYAKALDPTANDALGSAVAVSYDTYVALAPMSIAVNIGAAYTFR